MQQTQSKALSQSDSAIGLKAAVSILNKWKASLDTGMAILRVSRGTYFKAKKSDEFKSVSLDRDQLDRVSMILNMHSALRIIFDNPDNVYGFMGMNNNNPFFNGRSPLEAMCEGDFTSIYETFRRVDSLRGGGW